MSDCPGTDLTTYLLRLQAETRAMCEAMEAAKMAVRLYGE